MRSERPRRAKVLTLFAGVLALTAFMTTAASGQLPPPTTTIDLCAKAGTLSLPGPTSVTVWGFARLGTGQTCADVTAQVPGPILDIQQGESVQVNLENGLAGDVSFEVPGQAVEGPSSVASGGTGSFRFQVTDVGTFGYQSSGEAGRQMAMGLYGALVVRPAGESPLPDGQACSDTVTGQAYENAFDRECVLVLSAIDPAFNADPANFDMNEYLATYWLINGKAYPETEVLHAGVGQRLLLRYVNAGYDNTSMMVLGMHEQVVAKDADPLTNALSADSETIPAGATEDAIVVVPGSSSALPNGFPLYNRQLHLTNGTAGAPAFSPGGMLTFIQSP
jgi:FtsP/CotA-like multicopper oxidase with cupredoxin domain